MYFQEVKKPDDPLLETAGDTGTGRLKLRNGRFQQLLRHLLRRTKR